MDTPEFNLTQVELKLITGIDEFKGRWTALNSIAPERLSALRRVATIESIASSTRIEGVKLSDREVQDLLSGLQINHLHSRDEEEVAGYAECMEMVFSSYEHIPCDENHIKQLHQLLLKYASKDVRHRGEYKKLDNHVAAFDSSGKRVGIVFETSSPFETPGKMTELVEWLSKESKEKQTHPLLVIALFVVHFLAIHPFQDGNGRLSRILTTLLLLKAGYGYVSYSSLERIVEENKEQYYLSLRRTQKTLYSDNSMIMEWTLFFLHSLKKQIVGLEKKLENETRLAQMTPLSQALLLATKERGSLTVREAEQLTAGNRNTIKQHLRQLVENGLLVREGTGKGSWYRMA